MIDLHHSFRFRARYHLVRALPDKHVAILYATLTKLAANINHVALVNLHWRFPKIMTLTSYFLFLCSPIDVRYWRCSPFGKRKHGQPQFRCATRIGCCCGSLSSVFPASEHPRVAQLLFWCWRCHIAIGSTILERYKQKWKFLLTARLLYHAPWPNISVSSLTYLGRIAVTFPSPGGDGCAAFLTGRTTLVHMIYQSDRYDIR